MSDDPRDGLASSRSLKNTPIHKADRQPKMAKFDRIPNAETPLTQLFALQKVPGKEGTYMSLTPAWASGGAWSAFGGHVYAQSIWAATQEVPDGQVIHSCHGYFTLPGLIDRPYIYIVQHLNDTRGTSQRAISVYQPLTPSDRASDSSPFDISDANKPMSNIRFHMISSFKKPMAQIVKHQIPRDFKKEYELVMGNGCQRMEEAMDCPDVDTPWYHKVIKRHPEGRTFPGLDIRKADCREFNEGKTPEQWRQLNYYRLKGDIPESWEESKRMNLAAVAHAFASDRNSLFLISHALGFGDKLAKIASLGHSIIFHTDGPSLLLSPSPPGRPTPTQHSLDLEDKRPWIMQEAWTSRSGEGRGIHETRIYGEDGTHIATTMQDGFVRKAEGETQPMFENVMEILDADEDPKKGGKMGRKKSVGERWENAKL